MTMLLVAFACLFVAASVARLMQIEIHQAWLGLVLPIACVGAVLTHWLATPTPRPAIRSMFTPWRHAAREHPGHVIWYAGIYAVLISTTLVHDIRILGISAVAVTVLAILVGLTCRQRRTNR